MNRLDKWLQVSRMFRARARATEACAAGRVTVNGQQAKAHRQLKVGDRIEFRIRDWKRILVVRELRDKPLPKAEGASSLRGSESTEAGAAQAGSLHGHGTGGGDAVAPAVRPSATGG